MAFSHISKKNVLNTVSENESGSILAIAMLTLLLLSVLGTFALNTADYEIDIAANQQQFESRFNTAEGGAPS